MIELSESAGTDFVTNGRLKIDVDSPGNMLSTLGFREKCVERVVSLANTLVRWHAAIGVDSMFEAIEFPTLVTNLDTGLAEMDGDTFYEEI